MEGYFHRSRRSGALEKWRARLALESLEARDLFHVGGLIPRAGLATGALAARAAKNNFHIHQPLRIIEFTGVEEGPNEWSFEGQVIGDHVEGLIVQFGGIPSLEGQTATVDANGWFQITVQLQSGEHGTATAQTTDASGETSNLARTPVDPGAYLNDGNHRPHRAIGSEQG